VPVHTAANALLGLASALSIEMKIAAFTNAAQVPAMRTFFFKWVELPRCTSKQAFDPRGIRLPPNGVLRCAEVGRPWMLRVAGW